VNVDERAREAANAVRFATRRVSPPVLRPVRRPAVGLRITVRYAPAFAVVVAIIVALVVLAQGPSHTPTITPTPSLVPHAHVGAFPQDIVASSGRLWITSDQDGTVTAIDADTGRVARTLSVGAQPEAMAVGTDGAIWVALYGHASVVKIDPNTYAVQRVAVPPLPKAITVGEGSVWVASAVNGFVTKIDPSTVRIVKTFRVGKSLQSITAAYGSVWIADEDQHTVWRIDAHTYAVVGKIQVEPNDNQVVAGAGKVWVQRDPDFGIARIDPASNAVDFLETSNVFDAIEFTPAGLWTSDLSTDSFALLDPMTGRILRSIDVTQNAVPFAYANGALWSADVVGNVYRMEIAKK